MGSGKIIHWVDKTKKRVTNSRTIARKSWKVGCSSGATGF